MAKTTIVLKNVRAKRYNADNTLRKDPLFVPYPIRAKFYRSTLAFEDFKREFSKVGWRFEFANRFAHSTNVNYMNFHFVYTPETWYAEPVRFAVAFGKFSTSVYKRIIEHYEPAKILFFHYSLCDALDYLEIYKQIWNFLDDDRFDDDAFLMKVILDKTFKIFEFGLYEGDSFWLSEEQIFNSKLFRVISRQTYSRNMTSIVKRMKRVFPGEVAV